MHELIRKATAELTSFLESHLPQLGENWWETHVVNCLSFQQQRVVEERGLTDLKQMDFSGLLRVLDQNWYEISQKMNLPREGRSWVRELQSVRNRWAHLSTEPMPTEDLYRDADTLARVLGLLGVATELLREIEAFKQQAIADMSDFSQSQPRSAPLPIGSDRPTAPSNQVQMQSNLSHDESTMFKVGDLVVLRSDPSITVPIIGIVTTAPETQYQVFQNDRSATYYESQLKPSKTVDKTPTLSADDLRIHLTSIHLQSPSIANLYSLRSGRVHFVPYQYRPVLRLIRSDRPRLLIADEVGVGKTIEAGLIIKELQARTDISSVLVICPKALVNEQKWFREMKRFDEHFEALDGRMLRHCLREMDLEGEWPDRYSRAIVPFSLFNSDLLFGEEGRRPQSGGGLLELDPPPRFDLVIVDEAHHIRNADTYLHQAVRYFCDNAQAAVFLTATPVQLGSQDLFNLLNVLRSDLIIDRPSFEQMAEPNRFINAAIGHCRSGRDCWQRKAREDLLSAAGTDWGRLFLREAPAFQNIYDMLAEDQIDDACRIQIIRSIEELYTFSAMINRTRRRDIGEFTTRKPETLKVEFTVDQRELHDSLLDVVSRILARAHGEQNVKFMMTTIRRQAASCLYGLSPLLNDMLTGKLDSLETIDSTDLEAPVNKKFINNIRADIQSLLEMASDLDSIDPKAQAFIKVLQDKGLMANNKALVFSTFRHTLAYIEQHVAKAGLRYGLVHGGIPDERRAELRRRFALPKDNADALEILLSSEVGSEGLDFQFCDLIVNYDLPWNPMRIEQRIGRIDRYGQKSGSVAIINMVTPGTVDADIYERCLMRIGVFQHAVGGREEILGEITREINDIADRFSLTSEQRAERLRQLADNKIRKIQEETSLEEKQAELFGLTVPNQTWHQEIAEAESYWLSPKSLQRCVTAYLSKIAKGEGDFLLGDKALKRLRLNQQIRRTLLSDFLSQPRKNNPVVRQWEKYLKGTDPLLPVTFDQQSAADEPKAAYLNVLHPLIRQAARHLKHSEAVQVSLAVSSQVVPAGKYPFALYHWRKVGIRSDDMLIAVALDPRLESDVMPLLQKATDNPSGDRSDEETFIQIDKRHYSQWSSARANHMAENQEFVQHRQQSLRTSHNARRELLQDQIQAATDDKIRRMKQSELDRANNDFEERIKELERLADSSDIHSELVVQGSLHINEDGAV
ncbi:MAG: Swt1 family HEPN domain-containing protein [Rhodobacteraceae bacterium]|nr:Swt1 family HEPN domain-containing protein [Paracoccaceae bacterium]